MASLTLRLMVMPGQLHWRNRQVPSLCLVPEKEYYFWRFFTITKGQVKGGVGGAQRASEER